MSSKEIEDKVKSTSPSAPTLHWVQEVNLLYELDEQISSVSIKEKSEDDDGWSTVSKTLKTKRKKKKSGRCCRGCGKVEGDEMKKRFAMCAKCGTASYCSRECQVLDWKRAHKQNCKQYGCIRKGETIDHRPVIEKLLVKANMYLSPFYIGKREERGPGFLYLNSANTLEQLYLTVPIDINGNAFSRDITVRFCTKEDFRAMVKANFELATVAKKLYECNMNSKERIPVVVMLRCGMFVVLEIPYPPLGYDVCERMSTHHAEHEKLQLSLD